MKYSTIVIAALLGYAQAVKLMEDGDSVETAAADGVDSRRAPKQKGRKERKPEPKLKGFPGKFSDSESSDDDVYFPNTFPIKNNNNNNIGGMNNDLDLDVSGKGLIFEGEAAASSSQGQSVKILPDTLTRTAGVSTCWAKNAAEEDGSSKTTSTKEFNISGKIVVREDTDVQQWTKSSGSSDGSAQSNGEQGVQIDDSEYQGKLGALKSCSCEQDAVKDFH